MDFPSHGAGDGLLRRILGKKEMQWIIHEARLIQGTRRVAITSNELASFNSRPLGRFAQGRRPETNRLLGHIPSPVSRTGGNHTQRTDTYIVKPIIAIRSSIVLTRHAVPGEDSLPKFESMALERLVRGQYFSRPYLGRSECPAFYEYIEDPSTLPAPMDLTQDYGLCYFDQDYAAPGQPLYFAPMRVEHGVILYPSWPEVRKLGIRRFPEVAS